MAGFNLGRVTQAATTFNPILRAKRITRDVRQTLNPDAPEVPVTPGMPTVDQARIDREAGDSIRRRRGRSANVLAGDSAVPQSSLAVQSLLGGG